MFRNLPRYDELGETGLGWAPKMPSHWGLWRGKSLFYRVQREPSPSEGVVTCFRDGVVTLRSRRRATGYTESLKEIGYQGIRRGDLVIHAMDAFAGAVGVADSDGKGTPVYSVCVPRGEANPHYYAAIVREMARSSWILALSKGIRERSTDFRFEMFGTQVLPVPPVGEQAAIVKYLDHANARIDKAIAAKRRLIALLDERRVGVQAHLLLSANGNAARLKDFATVQTGLTLGKDYGSQDLTSYPYLRVANVQMGCVDTTSVSKVAVPEREVARFSLQAGDVLMTEGGDIDKLGRGTLWDGHIEPCLHQNHVFAVRCKNGLKPEFLAAWLAGPISREYFYLTAKKTTNLASTNSSTLGKLPITVPLQEEQDRLLSEIHFQTSPMVVAMGKAQREIDLLQEFRTRLVADVVMGQVDVRAIAATLPDATESFDNTVSATDDDLEEALSEGEE